MYTIGPLLAMKKERIRIDQSSTATLPHISTILFSYHLIDFTGLELLEKEKRKKKEVKAEKKGWI
jgi:hypothetical protein